MRKQAKGKPPNGLKAARQGSVDIVRMIAEAFPENFTIEGDKITMKPNRVTKATQVMVEEALREYELQRVSKSKKTR